MNITNYADTKQFINKEVAVNSLSFSGHGKLKSFPKAITIDEEEVTFVETGMRYLLQKGQSIVQLFDMNDGKNNYRLQFDSQNFTWTLLKISALPR